MLLSFYCRKENALSAAKPICRDAAVFLCDVFTGEREDPVQNERRCWYVLPERRAGEA